MRTRRLAITGTYGTGKTTVVRLLQQHFAQDPAVVAFCSPEYHRQPDNPFRRISEGLHGISMLADTLDRPVLKAAALFLQMTLFGPMEHHLASAWAPRWLISERQCLSDSPVYAAFYKPLVRADLDPSALQAQVVEAIGESTFAAIQAWVRVLPARIGQDRHLDLWTVSTFALEVFELPHERQLSVLQDLYQAELPEVIVVLTADGPTLARRLAERDGGPPETFAAQLPGLLQLQKGLRRSALAQRLLKPELEVHVLDTTGWDAAQTRARIVELLPG